MTAPRDRARGVDTGRGPEGFVPTSRDNRLVIFEEPLPERAVGRRAATRGHRPGAGHGGPAAVADEPTGDVDFRVASTSSSCCSRKPRSDAPSSWCSQPRDLTTEQSPTTATGLVLARFAVPGNCAVRHARRHRPRSRRGGSACSPSRWPSPASSGGSTPEPSSTSTPPQAARGVAWHDDAGEPDAATRTASFGTAHQTHTDPPPLTWSPRRHRGVRHRGTSHRQPRSWRAINGTSS
jgi:hypothetical protein